MRYDHDRGVSSDTQNIAIVLLMAFAAVVSSCASVDSTTTQYDLAMYVEDMLFVENDCGRYSVSLRDFEA